MYIKNLSCTRSSNLLIQVLHTVKGVPITDISCILQCRSVCLSVLSIFQTKSLYLQNFMQFSTSKIVLAKNVWRVSSVFFYSVCHGERISLIGRLLTPYTSVSKTKISVLQTSGQELAYSSYFHNHSRNAELLFAVTEPRRMTNDSAVTLS